MIHNSETINEIFEILEQLEVALVEYEHLINNGQDNSDLVHIIFRYAHNLKSTLFVIDKNYSSKLIHAVESNFDIIRKGKALINKTIIEKSLQVVDLLKYNLLNDENIAISEELLNYLERIYHEQENSEKKYLSLKLILNKEELKLFHDAKKLNFNFYQIEKLIESHIIEEDYNNLFIFEDIKNIGILITSFPKYSDLDISRQETILKIIFATKINEEELGMYIFDTVIPVDVEADLNNTQEQTEKSTDNNNLLAPQNILKTSIKKDKPLNILVIEEDFFSRRLLQNIFSEFGNCDAASNSEEAIVAFRYELENDNPYDIITSDIMLDDNDGYEIITLIREIEHERNIQALDMVKFMIISSLDTPENIIRAFELQVNSYLIKPVNRNKVIEQLYKLNLKADLKKYQYEKITDNTEFIPEFIDSLAKIDEILSSAIINQENEDIIFPQFFILNNLSNFLDLNISAKVFFYTSLFLNPEFNAEKGVKDKSIIKDAIDYLDQLVGNLRSDLTEESLYSYAEQIIASIIPYLNISQQNFADSFFGEHEDLQDLDLNGILDDKVFTKYLSEASELIYSIEANLLLLGGSDINTTEDNNRNIITDILGSLHSLKGGAGFLGISEIEEICIRLEDIFSNILESNISVTEELVSITLADLDIIKSDLVILNNEISYQSEPINTNSPVTDIKENLVESNFSQLLAKKADIKVDTTKLDKLFDLVGELITIQTIVINNDDLLKIKTANFQKNLDIFKKITRELHEVAISIRMVPLENLFNRMKRVVRDLSQKTGKHINFVISGEDTEMDKNIIQEITSPLTHILRNAIDHGIEPESERLEKGKNSAGTIRLNAGYEGNQIIISIEDDGHGLDKDKIISRAKNNGLILNDEKYLTDNEIWHFIFEPGFTTASEVSEISGRGVGLDVVKKNIDKLKGKIQIESKKDKGTVFTLNIPLTLAIVDAMLVRVGNTRYALPIMSIKQSLRPHPDNITVTMDKQELVKIRDNLYPVFRLNEMLNKKSDSTNLSDGILIIVETDDKAVGFFVDEIFSQQQVVVKGFNNYIGNVKGLTGCMILDNGEVGFILDIEAIINMAQK